MNNAGIGLTCIINRFFAIYNLSDFLIDPGHAIRHENILFANDLLRIPNN